MEYRLLPNVKLQSESSGEVSTFAGVSLNDVESALYTCIQSVQENYIKIGILLKKIQTYGMYSACSYLDDNGGRHQCNSVEEYAFLRFGLSKTVVYNAISIVDNFIISGSDGKSDIKLYPGLSCFGYSALCELVPLAGKTSFYDSEYGHLPEWVSKEIKPEMTVKQIREVKKQHKKTSVKVDGSSVVLDDEPDPIEYKADKIETDAPWEGLYTFKNDRERKFIFEKYRLWNCFSGNEFLGLTYYRIYLGNDVYAIAMEWKSEEEYYKKFEGGFRCRLFLYEKGKPFDFSDVSITTFLKIMHERNLGCEMRIWREMNGEDVNVSSKKT